MFRSLPEKLTPVVKPLMESVRRESDEHLQELTAKHLAHLLEQCTGRTPCPNDKILVNLCTFLRCDPDFTPIIYHQNQQTTSENHNNCSSTSSKSTIGNYNGIVTLNNQQKNAEKAAYKRSNSTGRGPGRPPATDIALEELLKEEDETQKGNRVQRRGATYALTEITKYFGGYKFFDFFLVNCLLHDYITFFSLSACWKSLANV